MIDRGAAAVFGGIDSGLRGRDADNNQDFPLSALQHGVDTAKIESLPIDVE